MNATAIRLIVKLWHDDCPDDPTEYDGWKVYSFSSRHSNGVKPEDVGFEHDDDWNLVPGDDLDAKLKSGLAFFLDYYEHGMCAWSLSGEGPQCQWDTARFAGLMVWESDEGDIGAKTVEDRRADAKRTIDRYTEWCNGSVYGYTVEAVKKCCECGSTVDASDEADIELPSCGGYYGDDIEGMVTDMKDQIGPDWKDYDVTFEAHPYVSGLDDEVRRFWKKEEK